MEKKKITTEEYYFCQSGVIKLTDTLLIQILKWAKLESVTETDIISLVEKMNTLCRPDKYFDITDYELLFIVPVSIPGDEL